MNLGPKWLQTLLVPSMLELGHVQFLPRNPWILEFGDMEGSRGTTLNKLKSKKETEPGVLHPLLLWGRSAGTSETSLKDLNPARNGLGLREEAG